MYAIIKTGGKQYKVEKGTEIYIEKLNLDEGNKVTFEEILMVGGEKVILGSPTVNNATVEGKVVKHGKGKKIRIHKYKAKKGYHKRQGHRQPYTKVVINKINA